jgi:hypothetical protein
MVGSPQPGTISCEWVQHRVRGDPRIRADGTACSLTAPASVSPPPIRETSLRRVDRRNRHPATSPDRLVQTADGSPYPTQMSELTNRALR